MKIEKLELKHLCGYLPHGLKFLTCYNIENSPVIEEMTLDYLQSFIDFPIDEKPLLLPLSALTEPMEDGTVPIVELAKIAGLKSSEYSIEEQDGTLVVFGKEIRYPRSSNAAKFFFEIEIDNCDMDKGIEFSDPYSCDFSPLNNQLQLFEYLYSIHADIFGLIPAGLAIDKRTI